MKKLLLAFIVPLLLVACGHTSGEVNPPDDDPPIIDPPTPVVLDFENVYFDNMTLTYDGNPHILNEVRGAPEGTLITYEGREEHSDVGTYTATALLTKDGYNDLTLTATLTINYASFENITFEGATFEYDGEEHSIYVTGVPSFATVRYTNNGQTKVGTYTVTATIGAPNYQTIKKTATLKILGRSITGVTFNDKTFTFDYEKHYIYVEGDIPDDVSITYNNNGQYETGSYEVVAILTGEGYEAERLTATLTIEPMELTKPGNFYDRYYIYDGNYHSVEVESAPSIATITYRCLNHNGTNSFKEKGFYLIEATVKTDNNHVSKLTAELVIFDEGTIGTNPNKEALEINENLTWDELYNALDKDSYTYEYYSGYHDEETLDDVLPDGLLDDDFISHTTHSVFATDGKEAYSRSLYTSSNPNYTCYNFYKEVNDDIVSLSIDDEYNTGSYSKFPKAAFSETICKIKAANAFVALQKGDNGEFLPGIDGDDFYNDVGVAYIEDGAFTVLMQHPRLLDSSGLYRFFYRIYKYYNIGNTSISLPDNWVPNEDYIKNNVGIDDFYLGGVRYGYFIYGSYPHFSYYWSAHLYVTYLRAVFLKQHCSMITIETKKAMYSIYMSIVMVYIKVNMKNVVN